MEGREARTKKTEHIFNLTKKRERQRQAARAWETERKAQKLRVNARKMTLYKNGDRQASTHKKVGIFLSFSFFDDVEGSSGSRRTFEEQICHGKFATASAEKS
jgi:hypothetical protein